MTLSDLEPADVEPLLVAWADAGVTCNRWRLSGEAPSPGLFAALTSDAGYQQVVRSDDGLARGLLQVYGADASGWCGYLGLMLSSTSPVEHLPVRPFLAQARDVLGLETVHLFADEDGIGGLGRALPTLDPVGRMRGHTRLAPGRYIDRLVFDIRLDAGQL